MLDPAPQINFAADPNDSMLERQLRQNPEGHRRVVLKSLMDGSEVPFLDDGSNKTDELGVFANVGRMRILKNLRKRDHKGRPIWVGATEDVRIFDEQIGDNRIVPKFDEKTHGAQLAENLARRALHAEHGRNLMAMQQKKAQEAATAAADIAVAKLAGALTGALDRKPKAGA